MSETKRMPHAYYGNWPVGKKNQGPTCVYCEFEDKSVLGFRLHDRNLFSLLCALPSTARTCTRDELGHFLSTSGPFDSLEYRESVFFKIEEEWKKSGRKIRFQFARSRKGNEGRNVRKDDNTNASGGSGTRGKKSRPAVKRTKGFGCISRRDFRESAGVVIPFPFTPPVAEVSEEVSVIPDVLPFRYDPIAYLLAVLELGAPEAYLRRLFEIREELKSIDLAIWNLDEGAREVEITALTARMDELEAEMAAGLLEIRSMLSKISRAAERVFV